MNNLASIGTDVLSLYPDIQDALIERKLREAVAADGHKIVVLDDDPTGVQTVHDISVYTDWSEESIRKGFQEKNKLFYILTNSRGLSQSRTETVHHEIGRRVARISAELGRTYMIVSRGDSTLRGHYPLETEVLAEEWRKHSGRQADGEILCPYFKEGGRFTIHNIHYVKYGNQLIPVGQTEFAKDKTFGYVSSDLAEYIEEKTQGRYRKESVCSFSLEELRSGDVDTLVQKLMQVRGFGKVIVNAVSAYDLKVFVLALYQAVAQGKYFLFRTAAGFVKEFGAVDDKPLLSRAQMITRQAGDSCGGLIVVGSHTEKTSKQLRQLLTLPDLVPLEFDSDLVVDEERFCREIQRVLQEENRALSTGKTVVVYTKRKLLSLPQDTKEEALARSVRISDAVQSLVGKLSITPAFVVAKGGITSSDIATKALQVKQAKVLGQIAPGIPVWETGSESRFPQIPYVIFPGNVGEESTLKEVANILLG